LRRHRQATPDAFRPRDAARLVPFPEAPFAILWGEPLRL
jgi:hypothetical protein